ncbi:MAG: hypothetical protein FWC85_04370, partial [Elusimicrobia bacterium]|nr:hypothetical protein [Elusimicrobiota bacterium]
MKNIIEIINNLTPKETVYGVGGFARDLLGGVIPLDIDLAVSKNAKAVAAKITKSLNGRLVTLDEANKIYRIVLTDSVVANVDISLIDGKDIKEDLS